MSTITKERLEQLANFRGAPVTRQEEQELARIALASLEAEPVMYLSRQNTTLREQFGTCDDWEINARLVEADFPAVEIPESDNYEFMPLYTAPPAPIEAEPVAYMWDSNRKDVDAPGYYRPEHKIFAESSVKRYGGKVVALYAAPLAPVVPDKITSANAPEVFEIAAEAERLRLRGAYASYAVGWNACRAAMLRGVEPVTTAYKLPASVIDALEKALQAMSFMGDTLNALDAVYEEDVEYVTPAFEAVREVLERNSPVNQDGWVACSERMPEDRESVLLWDIDLDDACSGHYSHQTGNFYQAGMIIDNEITHWMPLPAAPQQEVK